MASARAEAVAELLWELKRADKVSTYTKVARKAGFSPGAGGRTIQTTMKAVRRDWPHLQWWRAFPDDGLVEAGGEQAQVAEEAGFELTKPKDEMVALNGFEEHVMVWEEPEEEAPAEAAPAATAKKK
jgi:alkylated DNA nucleotide flippase Atl1